jgi:hypothetical protein
MTNRKPEYRKPRSQLTIEDLPDGYCRECNCCDDNDACQWRIALHYEDGSVVCEGFYPQDEEAKP